MNARRARGVRAALVGCAVIVVTAVTYRACGGGRDGVSIGDRNGDGLVTIACLGDSNTAADSSWCARLGTLIGRPNWRTVNRGVYGSTAVQADWPDAFEQLTTTLAADKPDVIIFAFGTNDVSWSGAYAAIAGITPTVRHLEPSVAALRELYDRAEAAGATAFIATTPPANDGIALRREYTRYFNSRLQAEFPPERVVDFFSGIDPVADVHDTLHLNAAGQAKLAKAALSALGLDR
jgi:lysophospholipase L1-like esterase